MRRTCFVMCALLACHPKDRIIDAPDAAVIVATSEASVVAPKPKQTIADVVERWNAAHNKHDARALQSLYDAHVAFYGTRLTAAECAKRKSAAFAKTPDFAQSIDAIQIEASDAGGETRVTFKKTTISNGKSSEFPAVLLLNSNLLIAAETDKITDAALSAAAERWCLSDDRSPNDRIASPFHTSALAANRDAFTSKHFAALQAQRPNVALGLDTPLSCPSKDCAPEKRECGFDMRVVVGSVAANADVPESILVEWVYVDAITNVLWYEDATGWKSEPLSKR